MADFVARLRSGPPIVADGGLGALLSEAVPGLRCPEEANLRAPESVVAVHASYIRAGAELIETNTFGGNRRKLATHLLDGEFEQINSAAVRIAREAREVSGRDVFIAGAIGPFGELEMFDAADHGPLYAEQAHVLEGRGVDLFMLETFFDLDELVAAVDAVRARLVPSDCCAAHLRRGCRDVGRNLRGRGCRPAGAARRCRDREQPRRRPARCADGARRHALLAIAARDPSEHRTRQHHRWPSGLPALVTRLLGRIRCAGEPPRSAPDRRLLRHDPGTDRDDPGRARRGTPSAGRLRGRRAPALAPAVVPATARRSSLARCARGNGS